MKIIFFGSAKFIIPLIEVLYKNFNLSLVVTTERGPNDSVPAYCRKNNIPFISIKTFSECLEKVKAEKAELGVLASFGLLLPQVALDIFPKGIINIHPSLLPQYRGAMPVQSALLNGDVETGVSIIKLDEEMDHGPILVQETEKIMPTDTTATLHERLFAKGAEMLNTILPEYIEDKINLKQQKHDQATFTGHSLSKKDGFVDVNNPPSADQLDRMIRAYYPWPGVWTQLLMNGKEKVVKLLPSSSSLRGRSEPERLSEGKRARLRAQRDRGVQQSDVAISNILLQVEGKKPITLKDFINGYPELKDVMEKILGPHDS